jgi:hypothetical protein
MKITASVLSVLAFYLLYWISRSIYLSTLDTTATIESIVRAEWIIAGAVCGAIYLANCLIFDSEATYGGAVIVIVTTIVLNMPYSLGLVILYNVFCIASVLFCIWKR